MLTWRESFLAWAAMAWAGVKRAWGIWSSAADFINRNARAIILVLLLTNAFGVIAPTTATALRDLVLGLVF